MKRLSFTILTDKSMPRVNFTVLDKPNMLISFC